MVVPIIGCLANDLVEQPFFVVSCGLFPTRYIERTLTHLTLERPDGCGKKWPEYHFNAIILGLPQLLGKTMSWRHFCVGNRHQEAQPIGSNQCFREQAIVTMGAVFHPAKRRVPR